MTEYTKGPWHVARESWHTMDIKSEDGDYLGEVMTYICGESDDSEQDWDTINERKANANLMAAAPELFEALDKMLDHFEGSIPLFLFEMAEGAISKARGNNQ